MGLEVATFVNDLNTANPAGSDSKSQGDDHLRLIKNTLKATFPLAIGARKFSDTDAGATDTLAWLLFRNSASPANGDLLASYAISGNNNAAAEKVYARIQGRIDDVTAGSEDGSILLKTMVGGVETIIGEMNAFRPITHQDFTASGTWTKPAGCRKVMVEAVGGGGGGGGCAGSVGNWAASGGGGSGFAGKTGFIDVTGVANGAVTIGAAGAASAAGNAAGGTGGTTQIVINAVTYTFPGGDGAPGNTANASDQYFAFGSSWAAVGSNTKGSSQQSMMGFSSKVDTLAIGSSGAPSPYGIGGDKTTISTTGGANGNAAAANTGAGGSGCVTGNQAVNRSGGAGGSGFMRVWEFY